MDENNRGAYKLTEEDVLRCEGCEGLVDDNELDDEGLCEGCAIDAGIERAESMRDAYDNPALFSKESQKEHKRMQKKLNVDEITPEVWSDFLDKQIDEGHQRWKNYSKKVRKNG